MIINFHKLCTLAEEGKIKITSLVPNPQKDATHGVQPDDIKIDFTASAKHVNIHSNTSNITVEFLLVNGIMRPVKIIYSLTEKNSTKFENYYEITFAEYNLSDLAELFGWTQKYKIEEVEEFIDNILKLVREFKYKQNGKETTEKNFSIGHFADKAKGEHKHYISENIKNGFATFEELVDEIKRESDKVINPAGV